MKLYETFVNIIKCRYNKVKFRLQITLNLNLNIYSLYHRHHNLICVRIEKASGFMSHFS